MTVEAHALRMRPPDRLSVPPPGLGKLGVDERRRLHDLPRRAIAQ